MDGISLYAIRHEIRGHLPLKVQKIYHPLGKELWFALWGHKLKSYLVLSLEGARPFVGIAQHKPDTPRVPSGVCLGLRKRLEGGTLRQIRQEGLDRILYFDFSGHDELGNARDYTLIFDGAGGQGGIGLVQADTVELSLTPARSRLAAGSEYIPPEPMKHNLLLNPDVTHLARQICSSEMPALMGLISHVEGIGKEHATSILSQAGLPARKPLTPDDVEPMAQILEAIREVLANRRFSAALYILRSGEPLLGVLPLHHMEPARAYRSLLEATSEYREYSAHFEQLKSLESQVKSIHKRITAKLTAKLKAQEEDLLKAEEYDKYRVWGELIHASGRELPRGHHEIKVLDYYQNPPCEIYVPLDPRFTSSENARRYYAKYSKLQRTAKVLQSSTKEVKSLVALLDEIKQRLIQADDINSLLSIQDELMAIANIARIRIPGRKHKTPKPAHPKKVSRKRGRNVETLQGPDGTTGYIGISSAGNDFLVRHLRRPGDIWLHAKGVKGAHVLLRPAPGRDITQSALDWAAILAAKHSEAASSGKVEVDWVDAGAINKPGGSPPGFVTYKGEKTIMVNIREDEDRDGHGP